MSCRPDIEKKITETSLEIRELMGSGVPVLFDLRSLHGRLMSLAMRDENFKANLFRFIDVLPALKDDALLVRMLKGYFSGFDDAPLIVRQMTDRISDGRILPHVAARIVRTTVETLARQFIIGRDIDIAEPLIRDLRNRGFAISIDLLGEEVLGSKEEKRYVVRYEELIDRLGTLAESWDDNPLPDSDDRGPIPRFDISLKISSFYSQLDPADHEGSIENITRRLWPLIDETRDAGASVTFDMEHYHHKDITIGTFEKLLQEHEGFEFGGIALQAYLNDTKKDLLRIIDTARARKRRVTVRLVKGAYWDYETVINPQNGWPTPVFMHKEETEGNFEELTGILLDNTEWVRPAVATHNVRSMAHAIAAAEAAGLPKNAYEFQMIYGMAEPVRRALKDMGYRIRLYAPVGDLMPGMSYLIRRLLENTAGVSFLRRSFFEKEPMEDLIKAPAAATVKDTREMPGQEVNVFRNEPFLDFSLSENRESMVGALKKERGKFGLKYPLLIGGREIITEREIVSRNPSQPDEVVGRVCAGTSEIAGLAVEHARVSWELWRWEPAIKRAEYLFGAAAIMRRQRFELAALEVFEVGKSWKEADADVAEAIDYLEYYGHEMIRLAEPRLLGDFQGEANEYVYEPKGVCVVISPWNFPLAIPAGMASAALVSGNTVIFKPSGLSPVIGYKLVEIFRQAGLPSGVLQFLPGSGGGVGEYLVSHPGIDLIAFTGSKDVGLRIVKLAGITHPLQRNVKKVIAEMGGKNAIIVDETADLDEAVKGVVDSAFSFQGQKCSACSRVVVIGEMHDEFCRRLADAAESIPVGPPEDPHNSMGPLVDEAALKKVKRYIKLAKNEGRPLLIRKVKGDGYFIGPALFADVDPQARIAREEIFGPVVAVIKAGDIGEALLIANDVPYALTGGIYSRSPENIDRAKKEFRAGNLYINRKITGALVGRQPFGGFGMSGVGSKAGGPDYLLQFLNPKSICENTLRKGFAPKQGHNSLHP